MNTHESWRYRYHQPDAIGGFRAHESSVLDRLREPSVIVPVLVLIVTVIYHSTPGIRQRLPLVAQIIWDGIVAAIPARALYALDGWLNPSLFPRPMPLPAPSRSHAAKSDLLRKILGIDSGRGGGIMASVTQASRRFPGFGSGFGSGPSSTFSFAGRGQDGQPAGLGNLSNSCYQNSILQGLAALKPLPEYLGGVPTAASHDDAPEGSDDGAGFESEAVASEMRTAGTLRDLITDLNSASNNGRTLWTPAILKNMSTWQQQDAQEYFSKLLDEVDREIARAARSVRRSPGLEGDSSVPASSPSPSSAADDGTAASQHSDDSGYQSLSTALSRPAADLKTPRNPLEGLVAQRVACVSCGWSEGLSMIPFNCITLSLGMDRHEHDLYERLDAYTKVEAIPGVECGKCTLLKAQRLINVLIARGESAGGTDGGGHMPEALTRIRAINEALEDDDFEDKTITQKCKITQKVSSTKTKQAVIARAPQSLVIHMNRSVFDETTGQMFKNLSAVRFPMLLDLGPWCLGSAEKPSNARPEEKAGGSTGGEEAGGDEEQWLLDPTVSMVAGDQHPSKITGPIYELRAVVTHYGRHENGHYVCYRKHPSPKSRPRRRRRQSSVKGVDGASSDKAVDTAALGGAAAEDDEGIDTKGADNAAPAAPPSSVDSRADTDTGSDVNEQSEAVTAEQPQMAKLEGSPAPTVISQDDKMAIDEGDEEDIEESAWWRLSDQNVTRVTEASVLSQTGVFMLFFDAVDKNPVLTSEISRGSRDGPLPPSTAPCSSDQERSRHDMTPSRHDSPPPTLDDALPPDPSPVVDADEDPLLKQAQLVPLPPDDEDYY